jgi:hypothetical protein
MFHTHARPMLRRGLVAFVGLAALIAVTPLASSASGAESASGADAAESTLPALPLPDCRTSGLGISDTTDCEGVLVDYSPLHASAPRPAAGAVGLAISTRTIDVRKDADRPGGSQTITLTWSGPVLPPATVGNSTYATDWSFDWPTSIEGGTWTSSYLKKRGVGQQWSPDTEGAPVGSSSNPPRVLFQRVGTCGVTASVASTQKSCSYQVTWGDYGTRVLEPLIFRVGVRSFFSWKKTNVTTGQVECIDLAYCGGTTATGYTTFRTDPPAPLHLDAQIRRLGPKQFELDASGSYPDVVQTNWSLPNPVFATTQPVFTFDFDDYTLSDTYNGGQFSVNVKDKYGRVAFGSVAFSFLQQVGTEGPLKIKTVTVVGVANGIVTLEVVVENTTNGELTKVGVIGKRTPASSSVKTSPASATIAAKGTKAFTVTMPADGLSELDAVTQSFGYQNTYTPVRSAPVTTHVVVADEPGPNCTPGAPVVTAATASSLTLTTPKGTCTASGATAATGLRVLGYAGSSGTATISKDVALASTSTSVTGLAAGTRYRFRLVATDSEGTGPNGVLSAWALPPFPTLDSFTNRQYQDFAGRAPSTAEKTDWSAKLSAGTLGAPGAISAAVDFAHWQKQSPNIRLYQAYFGRLPDASGLTYWSNKSRTGTSIYKISSTFAGSSEFTNKYGKLTNQQFVELVYQNVLGRPGDSGGVASWTSKLDRKVKNRGEVMVGFSESGEFVNKTKGLADTVNVYSGMLRRMPTTAELAEWKPQLDGGTPRTTLIAALLASAPYDARVP